jgi:hypothetical protein
VGEALVWQARAEAASGKKVAAAASATQALKHLEANADPAHPLIGARHARLSSGTTDDARFHPAGAGGTPFDLASI